MRASFIAVVAWHVRTEGRLVEVRSTPSPSVRRVVHGGSVSGTGCRYVLAGSHIYRVRRKDLPIDKNVIVKKQ